MVRNISFEEWGRRWGNPALIVSILSSNAQQFTISASKYAARCFKKSFQQGGFYKTGKKWKKRTRNYRHPILIETGELMNSIKYMKVKSKGVSKYEGKVQTNEKYGNRRGKKDIGYAAVHNEGVNDRIVIPRRQFMGHNDTMYREIGLLYNRMLVARLL